MHETSSAPTIETYRATRPHPRRKTGGGRTRQEDTQRPLVTIFTVVRNGQDTLAQTISSVEQQTYPNIEYLVIDGASTDATLDIIGKFEHSIDFWQSEPDLGPTDAFNKAISRSKGEFIFWLSSDDWIPHDYIGIAVNTLLESGADFVFGNVKYHRKDTLEFIQQGDPDYSKTIAYQMPRLNPPSIVVRAECFRSIGLFDPRYRIACDYEWLRRLHFTEGRGTYEPKLNVCHRYGGASDSDFAAALVEVRDICLNAGASRVKVWAAFWWAYLRRRSRDLAEEILPRTAYRALIRLVRRSYSQG